MSANDNDSNDGHFLQLLSFQTSFVALDEYVSELHTMRTLQQVPPPMDTMLRDMFLDFMNDLNVAVSAKHDVNKCLLDSTRYREEGNKVFKNKSRLLQAAHLYTKAIISAPAGSEALALAYANRAQALQSYGHYYEAYDDCHLAIHYGYPNQQLIKLVARQATCASKLNRIDLLQTHLVDLARLDTNNIYTRDILALQQTLNEMMSAGVASMSLQPAVQPINLPADVQPALPSNSMDKVLREQKIIETTTSRGRYMVAAKHISEHELVMRDSAIGFVPVNHAPICQLCAKYLLIPYPCAMCYGKVIYCSLKCMLEHKSIHIFECHAYKCDLFDKVGIGHLGMRIVVTEMPALVQKYAHVQSAEQFWSELKNNDVAAETSAVSKDHTDSLRYALHHLDKMPMEDLIFCAKVAELLTIYLGFFTDFFDMLQNVQASKKEWQTITASLILRRMGQCMVNASTIMLVSLRSNEFPQLCENLWYKPEHLKRGRLHKFGFLNEGAAAYFPYLSICNHACEHSFHFKFSGKMVEAYNRKPLCAGDELFNSYTLDYRKTTLKSRRDDLDKTYHFACKCSKCVRPNADQDYEQFHRYICVNKKCQKVFVPQMPDLPNLEWWDLPEHKKMAHWFLCTHCGQEQNYSWFGEFARLIRSVGEFNARRKLYRLYEELDKYLVGTHALKMWIGQDIVAQCFDVHFTVESLQDLEFIKLAEIVKYQLKGIAEESDEMTVEYVVHGTYLWDFIALQKYRCHLNDVQSILRAVDRMSDEMKPVFINYYEDYVKPNLLRWSN